MFTLIAELNHLSIEDFEEIEKFERTDKVYFLTNPEDTIPVNVIPYFLSFKVKPEFMCSNGENANESSLFLLGMLCASCVGNICIVCPESNNSLQSLDGSQYDGNKGKLTISVSTDIKSVLKKISKTKTVKTTHTPRVKKEKQEKPSKDTVSTTLPFPINEPEEVEEDYEAPFIKGTNPKLVSFLSTLDNPELQLVKNADVIAESVRNATDGFMTLELQIQLRLGKETATKMTDVLGDHYEKLKKLV